MEKENLKKDFQDFLNDATKNAPSSLNVKVTSFVKRELNPSIRRVLLKLIAVQTIVGLLSLLVCPQFGISLSGSHKLYLVFERFGSFVCMALCGAFFLGTGALFSSFALNFDEIRKTRNSKILFFLILGLIALAFLLIFGAKMNLSMLIAWILGAVLASTFCFELGSRLRQIYNK